MHHKSTHTIELNMKLLHSVHGFRVGNLIVEVFGAVYVVCEHSEDRADTI